MKNAVVEGGGGLCRERGNRQGTIPAPHGIASNGRRENAQHGRLRRAAHLRSLDCAMRGPDAPVVQIVFDGGADELRGVEIGLDQAEARRLQAKEENVVEHHAAVGCDGQRQRPVLPGRQGPLLDMHLESREEFVLGLGNLLA